MWCTYDTWPPASKSTGLYFHADGSLSFDPPGTSERDAHRDYISDPASPVPYRQRPISPTYEGETGRPGSRAINASSIIGPTC